MNPLYGEKRYDWARTKMFLETHGDVFDLEEQGENVMMRLRSSFRSAPRTTSTASPSVLGMKKCCNY